MKKTSTIILTILIGIFFILLALQVILKQQQIKKNKQTSFSQTTIIYKPFIS